MRELTKHVYSDSWKIFFDISFWKFSDCKYRTKYSNMKERHEFYLSSFILSDQLVFYQYYN